MAQPRGFLSLSIATLATFQLLATATAAEWSRFRGPNGSGVVESDAMPVELVPAKADWEAEVPFGRSSPILSARHVFLTATDGGRLLTLAIDRATGREVWRRALEREFTADMHAATDSASSTPVTDGENVYAFFDEAGIVSYDAAGNRRWHVSLGSFRNFYSVASSPILAGDALVLLCDQARGSFLVALDKDSGRQLWRQDRPGRVESYSTPLVLPGDGRPAAIVTLGSKWLDAYDPATGRSLWTLPGLGAGPVASPVLAGDMLYAAAPNQAAEPMQPFSTLTEAHDANGDGRLARAELEGVWIFNHFGWVDVDGDGWITESDWTAIGNEVATDSWGIYALRLAGADEPPVTVWNTRHNVPYIPTTLVYDGVLYFVDGNILSSADAATGELHKRGRIGAGSGKVYASPVAAGGKVYVGLVEGKVAVFEAGPDWRELALNDLGDEIYATPALADGEFYVRTRGRLFRFSVPAAPPTRPTP